MSRLRVAIIGCGRIAGAHGRAILASPLADLAALVDPEVRHARALAERLGTAAPVLADVAALPDGIDAAVIATPNHTHADLAERCLARGLHVLIEKPLATTVADAQRIVEAGHRAGRVVAVGYTTRFRPAVRLMADLLREQAFGQVRRFAYQLGTAGGWAPLSGYNLDRRASGGGVLVVSGTHFLDRMLHWFGQPSGATLVDDSRGGPEANALARFRFDAPGGPIHGTARFSKSVRLPAGIVLETEAGRVVLQDLPDAPVLLRPAGRRDLEIAYRRPGGTAAAAVDEPLAQLEDFVLACTTGARPMVTGEAGLESVRLLETLYANRTPMEDEWYAGPVREESIV